nr:MAG TPA: hypothetical protein [Caudoviricetes sp.]
MSGWPRHGSRPSPDARSLLNSNYGGIDRPSYGMVY